MNRCRRLRLLLGDQLNHQHSWLASPDPDTLYVIAELREEATYTHHHIQKLCAFFAAMARFARHLDESGHRVLHLTLDDTAPYPDLPALLQHLLKETGASTFEYQRADEYRLLAQLRAFRPPGIVVNEADSEHFLVPFKDLQRHFKPGKAHRMETFYRRMRREHHILMDANGEPAGGRWNFDTENRNRLKPADLKEIPAPRVYDVTVTDIMARLERHGIATIGQPRDTLDWPVDREQSLDLLQFFCAEGLPRFGQFQDAMTGVSEHGWSLYHSRLSFSLNTKLLNPREVIDAAVRTARDHDMADLAQVEGFVRQVLGWREFVRGIYWANMPKLTTLNALDADRDLPGFYWTGDTRMRCMSQAIGQSLDHAYAHHIQRLMVTGNFALLAGIDPAAVDDWYLGIYADALEWVQLPNTRGMSQFADGGLLASKPYAASGNYIQKMSDYCKDCHYNVKERDTDRACPFNSLYWHFMARHREQLESNPRIGMAYRTWDKMASTRRDAIIARANDCLAALDDL